MRGFFPARHRKFPHRSHLVRPTAPCDALPDDGEVLKRVRGGGMGRRRSRRPGAVAHNARAERVNIGAGRAAHASTPVSQSPTSRTSSGQTECAIGWSAAWWRKRSTGPAGTRPWPRRCSASTATRSGIGSRNSDWRSSSPYPLPVAGPRRYRPVGFTELTVGGRRRVDGLHRRSEEERKRCGKRRV